jgi:hypothetical protein
MPRPSASLEEGITTPREWEAIAQAIEHGPRGLFLLAGIATALLFVGWLGFRRERNDGRWIGYHSQRLRTKGNYG